MLGPDRKFLTDPLIDNNPVTLQILGICSALAVTTSLLMALIMSAALTSVLVISNGTISIIRHHVPSAIRLIVQIIIIASLVIIADEVLKAYAFEASKRLSVFVGLIVTNCIVLARAESFAMRNPPLPSLMDGLGNGLGYSLVLILLGTVRELLGAGTLLEITVLTTTKNGGWFEPLDLMLKPASAFFMLGFLVWIIRTVRPHQVVVPEFSAATMEAKGD